MSKKEKKMDRQYLIENKDVKVFKRLTLGALNGETEG